MLYYKNISKFPIRFDGKPVMPGQIYASARYINNRYMLRVSASVEEKPTRKIEPRFVEKPNVEEVKVEEPEVVKKVEETVEATQEVSIKDTKDEEVKVEEPKVKTPAKRRGRPKKAVESETTSEDESENKINIENNKSEDIDNG